ncbi:MAG: sugar transferase [Candidatus Gracilibacteria bacterium]|jgi:exopolysaccharide biosynthesis polyprenyl glycosylphosphotransferase
MKKSEIFFGITKIPVDFLMTVLAFFTAYKLRLLTEPIDGLAKPIDYTVLPTPIEYLHFSLIMASALVIIFALGRMYKLKTTLSFSKEFSQTFILCLIWAMFIITYFFFTFIFPFSRLAILYSWFLTFTFVISGRGIIKIIQLLFLKIGIGKRVLLFIGNNALTQEIYKKLKHNISYEILGYIGEHEKNSQLKFLGSLSQLDYLIKKNKIDEILQTIPEKSTEENEEILELCDLNKIEYRFAPDLLQMRKTNIEIEEINGIPIISLKHTPLDGWGKVVKRSMDVFGASVGLLFLSPIFLATALAIKIDSKGPILFTKLDDGQRVKRVGKDGKLFNFYKFRSMKPKTDSLRYTELAKNNLRKDGPLIKIGNDPRITKIGKFIRKYSIDELPQLFNVIKGDMSLVGPRPHLPEEVKNYKKHQRFVLTILPGITGISQISGRSDLSFEDEIKLDRLYIENWSLIKDIKIILSTFLVVLKGYKE